MAQGSLIEANNLAVRYPNGDLALHNVSFTVNAPTFMAIIGPNGSRGSIRLSGYDSVKEKSKIRKLVRYVPQRDRIELNVPMKVKDIVLMGRLLKKLPPRVSSNKDKKAAKAALEQVSMEDLWDHPFPELSGGQRQRVLVARALAGEGSILLLDEPLAGTDSESQDLIVEALGKYHRENDVSIIMVTHDLNPIHSFVRDVLLLKNTVVGMGEPCSVMPSARVVEYAGHRYCVTKDSGIDRHD
ncbi:MAG: metal ABC transporter ATP-binding protein [Candidatus Thorarchaeota archaeon]|jgi:ABC-type Mn2+/Zn2+ transport system ATPase subunit